MAKLPLQKNYYSQALNGMTGYVGYNDFPTLGVGLSKQESSASMSDKGVSVEQRRQNVSGKVFSFAKYLLARLYGISLTYLWQSEETLMINSLDHKSFPSVTN